MKKVSQSGAPQGNINTPKELANVITTFFVAGIQFFIFEHRLVFDEYA